MRARIVFGMMLAVCGLVVRTHAESVTCGPTLAELFAATHGESSKHTPATFEQKKNAFLSIYHAATEGLTIEELQGLMREPFEFKDFVDATNLSRAHEKLIMLKEKVLPNFSAEEQKILMGEIQTFLVDRILRAQKSHKSWNERRQIFRGQTIVRLLDGHSVFAVAFSPDGMSLASGSQESNIHIWDLTQPTAKPTLLKRLVNSVAFSPDGKRLASGGDRSVFIWNLTQPTAKPIILEGHKQPVYRIAFSPDGKHLASAGRDKFIRIWDVTNLRQRRINLWGLLKQKPKRTLKANLGGTNSIAFSPDGTRLASGSFDGAVLIWDLTQPTSTPTTLNGHILAVKSVSFSPDGKTLASGSDDGTIRIWDLKYSEPITIMIKHHISHIMSVAFSPDGKVLVSGSSDGAVLFWDLTQPFSEPNIVKDHLGWVSSVAFSPDGDTLASAGQDRVIRLWKWREILNLGPDRLEEDGAP